MSQFSLSIINAQEESIEVKVDRLPDKCPICHVNVLPLYVTGVLPSSKTTPENHKIIQTIFKCPRINCQELFIADYIEFGIKYGGKDTYTFQSFELRSVAPSRYQDKKFPESICEISSMFCNVFNQSAHAESLRLTDIAGSGYRKALEFLVKDFLISEETEKADSIKEMALMNAIKNKIQDVNIKKCATRATWLGNDETHYLRKWNDHDISDLKRLITLTVNWIENSILTKEYENTMPDSKKT